MWQKKIQGVVGSVLLPPFPVVIALSLTCLIAFAAWIYFDPWFAMIKLVMQSHPVKPSASGTGETTSYAFLTETFQPRANLFVALRFAAIVVTVLAVIRMFVGSRSGRTLVAWLAMTALLAGWLGLLFGFERLKDAGFRYRIHARISELQPLADALRSYEGQWTSIETGVGTYHIDPVNVPNTFMRRTPQGWWTTTDPWMILRLNDTGLLMLMPTWSRFYVEYHPNGGAPAV